jgi:hypothetical protein
MIGVLRPCDAGARAEPVHGPRAKAGVDTALDLRSPIHYSGSFFHSWGGAGAGVRLGRRADSAFYRACAHLAP